jgi:hypothetical protein
MAKKWPSLNESTNAELDQKRMRPDPEGSGSFIELSYKGSFFEVKLSYKEEKTPGQQKVWISHARSGSSGSYASRHNGLTFKWGKPEVLSHEPLSEMGIPLLCTNDSTNGSPAYRSVATKRPAMSLINA